MTVAPRGDIREPFAAAGVAGAKQETDAPFAESAGGGVMMIACCIDIPENDEEAERQAKQNFSDSAENAYMG